MSTYGLKGVIERWAAGKLTNEQAIGQILQLLEIMERRLNELERRERAQREQRAGRTPGEVNEISSRQELYERGE
jgi:ribosomal protein S2